MRRKLVVRFAIDGDVRFISHQDTVRLFERAMTRAGWPVRFTEGFNPRPRLSLPLPRNVGVASDDEILVVETEGSIEPDRALECLAEVLPAGLRLIEIHEASAKPKPLRIWYELPVEAPAPHLDAAIQAFLGCDTHVVKRTKEAGSPIREVDIRPYVETASREGERLQMVLRVTPQGTARPMEVLDALGLPGTPLAHRLRRTRVDWSDTGPTATDCGQMEEAAP
ncbi:MAG: DUF2344 domain-containing protein [Phycisphaerae bacterium]|nr:DUF2344 domain-containing protein [Phycisphaerae bacterium]